ncbi:MAG: hypothetical protein B6A08_09865 [Sorangiineae bacterium NIC37A_2]|jgi:purine-binding chemotaxis protein CheW|nr:MAG: hypothetical protein B6A08_09865 [Sorangiineae bacterium NIC37A_2]
MAKLALQTIEEESRRDEGNEFLSFSLAGESYAVPLASVLEIVVPPPLTEVPRAPKAILGVASVRGRLLTVVDLRVVLGVEGESPPNKGRLLLGRGPEDELMAARVDEVDQVLRLPDDQVEQVALGLGADSTEVVRGIGRPGHSSSIVLLDLGAALSRGTR